MRGFRVWGLGFQGLGLGVKVFLGECIAETPEQPKTL